MSSLSDIQYKKFVIHSFDNLSRTASVSGEFIESFEIITLYNLITSTYSVTMSIEQEDVYVTFRVLYTFPLIYVYPFIMLL